jgi:OmpA-OmpF porin, OOP family
MKKTLLVALALAASAFTPSAQAAAPAGPYISVDGGAIFFDDVDLGIGGLAFDTGVGGGLAIGQNFGNGAALELQASYYDVDMKGDAFNGQIDLSGSAKIAPVFANLKFNIPMGSVVSLDLGAGAGGIYSDVTATASAGSVSASASESAWDFGAQGLAGLNFKISENIDLKATYRFLTTLSDGEDLRGHYVGAGLNIRF